MTVSNTAAVVRNKTNARERHEGCGSRLFLAVRQSIHKAGLYPYGMAGWGAVTVAGLLLYCGCRAYFLEANGSKAGGAVFSGSRSGDIGGRPAPGRFPDWIAGSGALTAGLGAEEAARAPRAFLKAAGVMRFCGTLQQPMRGGCAWHAPRPV